MAEELDVVMIALAFLLCGCFSNRSAETGAVTGVVAGQPVVLKWTRDTEGTTTVDIPPALITAATDAATGNWMDLAIKTAAGISVAVAAWNAKGAQAANKRADEHKADAAEGWAEAMKP